MWVTKSLYDLSARSRQVRVQRQICLTPKTLPFAAVSKEESQRPATCVVVLSMGVGARAWECSVRAKVWGARVVCECLSEGWHVETPTASSGCNCRRISLLRPLFFACQLRSVFCCCPVAC